MKHRILLALSLLTAACGSTEPSAKELALAKVWVVHVDRPAGEVKFLVGTSEWLTATAFDSAGVPMTTPLDFEWYSGDSSVIAVDQEGRITAKKPGFTWVFAKLSNGIYGFHALTVSDPAAVFALNPESSRLLPGLHRTLVLQARDDPRPVSVHGWTSSNTAVATVDDNGVITAVAPGRATMSVAYAGATFTSDAYVADMATPLRFSSVVAGFAMTCGLTTDGAAYCWGSAAGGVLGSTEPIDRCVGYQSYPLKTAPYVYYVRSSASCAMIPVRVATMLRFTSIDARTVSFGPSVICGTTSTQEVYCWGETSSLTGASPGPAVVPVSTQLQFTSFSYPCGVTPTGDAWCFGDPLLRGAPATSSTTPTQVTGAGIWRVIASGSNHRCGVTTSDEVKCWGNNDRGQLGTSNFTSSAVPVPLFSTEHFASVTVGGSNTCALSLSNQLYCWGSGRSTPSLVPSSVPFTALSTSSTGAVCARGTDAVIYCGSGDGPLVDPAPGLKLRAVSVGYSHTCGIGSDGLLYCWGHNDFGETGTGDLTFRNSPSLPVIGQ